MLLHIFLFIRSHQKIRLFNTQLFQKFADNHYMGDLKFNCKQVSNLGARHICEFMVEHGYALELDEGYRVIDYLKTEQNQDKRESFQDGRVFSEEVWENSLRFLDKIGPKQKFYHKLRKKIEQKVGFPISWALDDPLVGKHQNGKKIRRRIQKTILKLRELFLSLKEKDPAQYQKALVVCLYWFCWVDNPSRSEEITIPLEVESFLFENGLEQEAKKFALYLRQNGGLGLKVSGESSKKERTALEMLLSNKKEGWCTELSEIFYAVLRMAEIEVFFVEASLPLSYYLQMDLEPPIPLTGHVASSVGIRLPGKNGREKVWIIDLALRELEADYVDQYPYWELSLRHFLMIHLSNLGRSYVLNGRWDRAKAVFGKALALGEDSAAFYAMGNYAYLLNREDFLKHMDQINKLSERTVKMRPDFAVFQYNHGLYLGKQEKWFGGAKAFCRAIELDPRYTEVYRDLGIFLYNASKRSGPQFPKIFELVKAGLRKASKEHLRFVQEGMKVLKEQLYSLGPLGKELFESINDFEKRN